MTTTPPQSKQGIFSSIPGSSRRPSTSSIGGYSPSLSSQGIGYSPSTPVSSASSGIPSFRSLRSLLPFGPNKNATPVSISVSPNSSRSPFAGFGSVRRSMTKERERKVSLSNDAIVPVIAIERLNNDPFPDDTAIRRSVSLSTLDKPLPSEPSFEGSPTRDLLPPAFTLRTPSPGPPLSAELSTIIEADNSGASKHISTTNTSPTRINPTQQHDVHDSLTPECDIDASALDLSTTHLADQVRDAIREGDSLKRQWLNPDEAVIIDGDEHPEVADATFNMDTVDRDLAALLSPHSVTKNALPQTNPVPNNLSSHGPITPNSPASPISRLPRARQASSFLPRLRPSNSPSPSSTIPQFPVQAPSPTTPKASPLTVVNGNTNSPPPSPALPSASTTSTPTTSRRSLALNHTTRLFSPSSASSSFSTPKAAKTFAKQYLNNSNSSTTPNLATRALRQVMPSVRTNENATHDSVSSPLPSRPTVTLGRTSLDSRCASSVTELGVIGLGRPSLEIPRGASFDSRTRPRFNRSSTSPDRTETATTTTTTPTEADSSPSPDMPFEEYRPSFDSNTTTRPSFDSISRPDSAPRLRDWDGQRRTPSLRVVDTTVRDRASPVPKITNPLARMRKRSMSVQERFGRGGRNIPANEPGAAAVFSRPGSSLSGYGKASSRGAFESSGNESGSNAFGPKMEWLGPRTAKAFRAAGLLDFEREKERDREEGGGEPTERLRGRSGSTSGVLSPSPLGIGNPASTLNRFASLRSASEYNPIYGRSHSRLALSEAGTGGSGVPGRRGSESFSAYGASSHGGNGGGGGGGGGSSYGHGGLMESPTFTVSSGSRERDTPKSSSTSTAPTSLADSFGYLGRDRSERDLNRERERDREREEMREMKEKHGIEMGALLGALSDSQRTVRVLREENSDLRDRLERLTLAVQATEELRQACGDLENECSNLRRENTDLRRELRVFKSTNNSLANGLSYSWSAGNSSGIRTPVPKTATSSSSPLSRTFTPRAAQEKGEEYDNTFIDHGSEVENHPHYYSSTNDTEYIHDDDDDEHGGIDSTTSGIILPPSSSTSSQKRRLSDASSIFPTPPSNMTLLLHEDPTSTLGSIGGCNRSSADHSQYGFALPPPAATTSSNSSQRKTRVRSLSQSPPISYRNFAGNIPNTTVVSISPTTANFSMVTGSPGSLFLRPEHEILLGDMESLDLGIQCGDGEVTDGKVDGW